MSGGSDNPLSGKLAPHAGGWWFEPTFNRAIKLWRADLRLTSDAGALLLREAEHRPRADGRPGRSPRMIGIRRASGCTQVELLRQHVYALALGYAHQDDRDALATTRR